MSGKGEEMEFGRKKGREREKKKKRQEKRKRLGATEPDLIPVCY